MAKVEASVLLYAVDLDELREWVGGRTEAEVQEVLATIGEDEDAGWIGELQPTFERLVRRALLEGTLYAGLETEDRYFLTQILIDIFDEYVDAEALSEELPLDRLLEQERGLPKGGPAPAGLAHLIRGRELNGDGLLWTSGPFEDAQPYLGYVTRLECGAFAAALEQAVKNPAGGARPPSGRPSGLLKQLAAAARECAETEFDLVSFVG
jgi:hypothetical protein